MNDRELLEKAAKAAGMNGVFEMGGVLFYRPYENHSIVHRWNPLTDDGDALRLAVKLKLFGGNYGMDFAQFEDGDPYAATRRAIVRAAVEIGKEMK